MAIMANTRRMPLQAGRRDDTTHAGDLACAASAHL
jgi:hypothetical protein